MRYCNSKKSAIAENFELVSQCKLLNNRSSRSLSTSRGINQTLSEQGNIIRPISIYIKKKKNFPLQSKRSSVCIYYNDGINIRPELNKKIYEVDSVLNSDSFSKKNLIHCIHKETFGKIRKNIRPLTSHGKIGKIIKGSVLSSVYRNVFCN